MMKVVIQRHGIVIKSVAVEGDRASIGSSPEANVVIDDPYLASQVADLVRMPDGWHLVDSGTSLEGITKNGQRVDDELVVAGQPYSLGGFELVLELGGEEAASQAREIARKTAERIVPGTVAENRPVVLPTMAENIAIPHTMMETELPNREIPKTMFETPNPAAVHRQAATPQSPALVRPAPAAPVAAVAPARKPNPRRVLLLAAACGVVLLLLVVVIIGSGGKKEAKPKSEVAVGPVATPATKPVVPAAPRAATPAESLGQLRYDEALSAWEKQLAASSADAATRTRYADLAMEVGRIHAANGSGEAAKYFSNVVKYGAPESAAVAEAKKRLAR